MTCLSRLYSFSEHSFQLVSGEFIIQIILTPFSYHNNGKRDLPSVRFFHFELLVCRHRCDFLCSGESENVVARKTLECEPNHSVSDGETRAQGAEATGTGGRRGTRAEPASDWPPQ